MWFWFFMLMTDMLVPMAMLFVGIGFLRKAPKEINFLFGYRTNMSMKNRDTWEFAHKLCGRIWLFCGAVASVVTLVLLAFAFNAPRDTLGNIGMAVCFVWLAVMIGSIIPVEVALRKTFDKDGNRKR